MEADLPTAFGKEVGFSLEGQPIDADPALIHHEMPSLARYTIFANVRDGGRRMG